MELQSGTKIAAHAGFLGTIYSYTSSEGVKHTKTNLQNFIQ